MTHTHMTDTVELSRVKFRLNVLKNNEECQNLFRFFCCLFASYKVQLLPCFVLFIIVVKVMQNFMHIK